MAGRGRGGGEHGGRRFEKKPAPPPPPPDKTVQERAEDLAALQELNVFGTPEDDFLDPLSFTTQSTIDPPQASEGLGSRLLDSLDSAIGGYLNYRTAKDTDAFNSFAPPPTDGTSTGTGGTSSGAGAGAGLSGWILPIALGAVGFLAIIFLDRK